MKVLVTRPDEDAAPFAARLAACGVESVIAPLIEIRFAPGLAVGLDGIAAVLLTSANGARALATATSARTVPLIAVGPATAEAARRAGFADVTVSGGDVAHLAATVRQRLRPQDGALLHVAGSAVAGDLAGDLGRDGYEVRRLVAYHAEPAARLPRAAAIALAGNELHGVAFFSPRTAETFVRLVAREGLDGTQAALAGYCLSPAVMARLSGQAWGALHVASAPDGDRLAELICAHAGQR